MTVLLINYVNYIPQRANTSAPSFKDIAGTSSLRLALMIARLIKIFFRRYDTIKPCR